MPPPSITRARLLAFVDTAPDKSLPWGITFASEVLVAAGVCKAATSATKMVYVLVKDEMLVKIRHGGQTVGYAITSKGRAELDRLKESVGPNLRAYEDAVGRARSAVRVGKAAKAALPVSRIHAVSDDSGAETTVQAGVDDGDHEATTHALRPPRQSERPASKLRVGLAMDIERSVQKRIENRRVAELE